MHPAEQTLHITDILQARPRFSNILHRGSHHVSNMVPVAMWHIALRTAHSRSR